MIRMMSLPEEGAGHRRGDVRVAVQPAQPHVAIHAGQIWLMLLHRAARDAKVRAFQAARQDATGNASMAVDDVTPTMWINQFHIVGK